MRIEPSGTYSPVSTGQVGSGKQPAPAPRSTDSGAPGIAESTYTPTSQLASLLDAVRAEPDVRTDAVQQAAAKLTAGELHTPAAAAESAQAITDAGHCST